METFGTPEPDQLLGPEWVSRTLALREHPAARDLRTAVLVHHAGSISSERAVLCIPGFLDYFFNVEHANAWRTAGVEFYALEQRGQGRAVGGCPAPAAPAPSVGPTRTSRRPAPAAPARWAAPRAAGLEAISDLRTRHVEIAAAIAFLRRRGHRHVTLVGHSTGGLQVPIYAADQDAVGGPATRPDALVLNSPWLAFAEPAPLRFAGMLAAAALRPLLPGLPLGSLSGLYARGLHRDFGGEWDFDTSLKPIGPFPVRAGFLDSVRRLQSRVAAGLDLSQPVFLACSARRGLARDLDSADLRTSDTVLNPEQMVAFADRLGRNVTVRRFEGAVHDISLSAAPVRSAYAAEVTGWAP